MNGRVLVFYSAFLDRLMNNVNRYVKIAKTSITPKAYHWTVAVSSPTTGITVTASMNNADEIS